MGHKLEELWILADRHYTKGGEKDKEPTTRQSCLHLLYLCEEKTLAEGRLAEREQEFFYYQST